MALRKLIKKSQEGVDFLINFRKATTKRVQFNFEKNLVISSLQKHLGILPVLDINLNKADDH